MARFVMTIVLVQVLAVALLQCATADNDHDVHTVGDRMGWTVPQGAAGAAAYADWAADEDFEVGDTLVFNFPTGVHDVLQVPKASFEACSSENPIGSLITTGPANVTLTHGGEHFFICTIGQHCQNGQKLAIRVSNSTGTPTSPTANIPRMSPPFMSSAPAMSAMPPAASGSSTVDSSLALVLASFLTFLYLGSF